jgi:ribonuclease BN (tRNA processing enzyme)
MNVKFLGVGEAFDEILPNTSIWVRTEDGGKRSSVLLDCGFTAPPPFWQNCTDPDDLDAIWISHFHGDHYFGMPALLTRFWEAGRKKPLLILGQQGVDDAVLEALALAYPSVRGKIAFDLQFRTIEPDQEVEATGLVWQTALNAHPQRDLAVRILSNGKSLFYSGDGRPTQEALALANGCDLIIHEAFHLDQEMPGHGNIMHCIEFARRANARSLALVHIQRDERRNRRGEILRVIGSVEDLRILMPEPGEEIEI